MICNNTLQSKKILDNNYFDECYLLITLLISSIYSNEILTISLLMYGSICILKHNMRVKKYLIRLLLPLIMIFCIGIICVPIQSKQNTLIDIFRDMWILINPMITITCSYFFAIRIKNINRIINVFIKAATIMGLYHIIQVLINISYIDGLYSLRNISGGYNIVVLGLSIILTTKLFDYKGLKKIIIISILLISLALSFSRTYFICLMMIVLLTNIRRFLSQTNRVFYKIFKIIIVSFLLMICTYCLANIFKIINLSDIEIVISEFINKILNSINEVSYSNFNTIADIQHNWRGYEAYRALNEFNQGNLMQKIFGYGFGKRIELGLSMKLDGSYFTSVPYIHNGYMYLIVKFGVIGTIFYILSNFKLITMVLKANLTSKNNYTLKYYLDLALALVFIISILTYIVNGIISTSILYEYLSLLFIIIFKYKLNINHRDNAFID